MGNDGGASCKSCVMIVMAMTVNCGGNRAANDDDSEIRSPSPAGPFHRAFRKHVFRPRGTAKPVLECFHDKWAVYWEPHAWRTARFIVEGRDEITKLYPIISKIWLTKRHPANGMALQYLVIKRPLLNGGDLNLSQRLHCMLRMTGAGPSARHTARYDGPALARLRQLGLGSALQCCAW